MTEILRTLFVCFSVPTFVSFLKEVESPYEVRRLRITITREEIFQFQSIKTNDALIMGHSILSKQKYVVKNYGS